MKGFFSSIRSFFQNLSLREKIALMMTQLLIVLFFVFGVFIIRYEKQRLIDSIDQQVFDHIKSIQYMLNDMNLVNSGKVYDVLQIIEDQLQGIEFENNYNESKQIIVQRISELVKAEIDDISSLMLSDFIDKFHILNTGYAFIVSRSGNLLVHPTDGGTDISDRLYFHMMSTSGKNEGKLTYIWPENDKGKDKMLYYIFDRNLNLYYAVSMFEDDMLAGIQSFRIRFILASLILILISSLFIYYTSEKFISGIKRLVTHLNDIALGKKYTHVDIAVKDEIGEIFEVVNNLSQGLGRASMFAQEMGRGNLDAEFKPLSDEDALGNALLEMRKSLKKNKEEEQTRRIEDEKRSWTAQGVAKINDILRNSENLEKLGDNIVLSLVELLNANQSGLFIYEEEEKDVKLKLIASFAYGRKKFLKKEVLIGEGLVGACAREKKTIYLREVPEDYIEITSGLGKATPRELIITPLIYDKKILGVIEIASFNTFEQYQIEFLERIAETIASTLSSAKINATTSELLEQSRLQSEELASREEELRQNMEEMAATQEESQRREKELIKEVEDLREEIQRLKNS